MFSEPALLVSDFVLISEENHVIIFIYFQVPSFEIQADSFMSLESI